MHNTPQRLLGFDFGLRRIGVASGQMITRTASPVTILLANDGVPEWPQVLKLIQQWRPEAILVGIPLNMDGSDCSVTIAARKFLADLATQQPIPVHPVDERLTTKEARQQLRDQGHHKKIDSKRVDAMAACLIVETWMNHQPGVVIPIPRLN
jgi:putative Holliday junction resolvase